MINLREQAFEKKWAEVKQFVFDLHQKFNQNRNPHSKKRNQIFLYKELSNLNFVEMELMYELTFRTWLIDRYSCKPNDLIDSLKILYDLNYPYHSLHDKEIDVVSKICTKDNAQEILESLFTKIGFPHSGLYQLKPSGKPPCASVDFESPLFLFLLDKHEKYSLRFSPLFWAIENEELELIEKILTVMPSWLNGYNSDGLTPLMFAIQLQKEKSLLKLMEFCPDIHQKNFKKETIAHILCSSLNISWISKLKNDPNFAYLGIKQMLVNPKLNDINNLLPLYYAFYRCHFNIVQEVLEASPEFKSSMLLFYKHVITLDEINFLAFLYYEFDLDIYAPENKDLLCQLLTSCVDNKYLKALDWMLGIFSLDDNIRNIFLIYSTLKNKNFDLFITLLNLNNVDWGGVSGEFCFSITRFLVENDKHHLIVESRLFDRHLNFHRWICPNSKEIVHTAISIISNIQEKHHSLLNYFLDYIDRHNEIYPQWLAGLDNHLQIFLTKLPMNKNRLVNGLPLFHFLENYYFVSSITNPEIDWLKKLKDFVDYTVDLNTFDQNNHHLFAKLLDNEQNGFERIEKLKKQFQQITLENLDAKGSNLLHLAIEKNHQKCILWCLKSNVDICNPRTFDNQSPMEMVFEMQNFELFENMRKFVKKSQFIDYLIYLIKRQKDAIIELLLSVSKPFGWEITLHHQALLRKIPHTAIQNFLKQFEKNDEIISIIDEIPTAVIEPPVKENSKIINHEYLLKIIREGKVIALEELLDSSYKETIKSLFDNNFTVYLAEVFNSTSKNINKTFIRFPDAQQAMTHSDACHTLFSDALEAGNKILIDNMLGREFVLKILKGQALRHLKTALRFQAQSYGKKLLPIFDLGLDELKLLFFYVIELNNIQAIDTFFEMDNHRQILKELDVESWTSLFKHEHLMESLFKYNDVQRYFVKQLQPCFSQLIQENQFHAIQQILNIPKLRVKIFENKTLLEEIKSTRMFSLFIPFIDKDLAHAFFEDALSTNNQNVVDKMLENKDIHLLLQPRAREYLQVALTFHPYVWIEKLLRVFQLSQEDLNTLWIFTLASENTEAVLSFLSISGHHLFLQNTHIRVWQLLLSKGARVIEFLLSHPELNQHFEPLVFFLFLDALKENHLSIMEAILSSSVLRAQLFNAGNVFLDNIENLKLMPRLIFVLQSFEDVPWDLFFIYALRTNKKNIILSMLNNQSTKTYLRINAVNYVQIALGTFPKLLLDLILDSFSLDDQEFKTILQGCLMQDNRDALLSILRRPEIYTILENASIETWIQLFCANIDVMNAILESSKLQKIADSKVIDCFNQALEKNDIAVLLSILHFPKLRSIIRADANQILRYASSKDKLNFLIEVWTHHFDYFRSILGSYVPVVRNVLPREIVEGFHQLNSENRATYLVGSAVHCLINGNSLAGINDIDFISSHEPPAGSRFIQSRVQPKLFFSNTRMSSPTAFFSPNSLKIECFVNAHDPKHFIAEDYLQRDFTVNCLYADSLGNIYDPTGLGIYDLQTGLIRCVKDNPLESFNHDPIRILRAIRLIMKGYVLLPNVAQAIHDWQPNDNLNFGHIYAMTKTLLASEHREYIFVMLNYFGLIKKLLGFDEINPQLDSLNEFIKGEVARDTSSPLFRQSPVTFCNPNPASFQLNSSSDIHYGHNTGGNFFNGV